MTEVEDKSLIIAGTNYITEIPSCDRECSVWDKCKYDRRARLCGFRYELFSVIAENLREMFPNPDARIKHYINFALVPLYLHLLSLRLEIRSFNGILKKNKMDGYSYAYKEMRETSKQIMNTLKEMGIKNIGAIDGSGPAKKLNKVGNSDYYGQLLSRKNKK